MHAGVRRAFGAGDLAESSELTGQFCTQRHFGKEKERGYGQFAFEKWISLELSTASNPHVGKC